MTNNKVDIWLSRLEKLILLLRSKFHNSITKYTVFFGLGLLAESKLNIVEPFLVALFEYYFGKSDFLRGVFSANSIPWWTGLVLVALAFLYNATVTVGLELIQKYKLSIPKKPTLVFEMLNADEQILEIESVLRGKQCEIDIDDIPDYEEPIDKNIKKTTFSLINNPLDMINRSSDNKDFYRDRSKLLKVWGGAEIITLFMNNTGMVLLNNIKVEIRFNKVKGLSLKSQNKIIPDLPSRKNSNHSIITPLNRELPDIYSDHTSSEYIYLWHFNSLQAGDQHFSDSNIFIRTDIEIKASINIFCDELSKPIEQQYIIKPAIECINIDLNTLTDDEKFNLIMNDAIMDGFVDKYSKKLCDEWQYKKSQLTP